MARRVSALRLLMLLLALWLTSCSIFGTRDPEPPIVEGGTYVQPDTPDQVIVNVQSAVAELNALNYRRSLSETIDFQPTATALQRDAIWSSWGRLEEEQYFTTLAAAAENQTGHSLELFDRQLIPVDEQTSVLDATYRLTLPHRRTGVPTQFQGKLVWTLARQSTGLWEVTEWTDQEIGAEPSWSDLKAAFVR